MIQWVGKCGVTWRFCSNALFVIPRVRKCCVPLPLCAFGHTCHYCELGSWSNDQTAAACQELPLFHPPKKLDTRLVVYASVSWCSITGGWSQNMVWQEPNYMALAPLDLQLPMWSHAHYSHNHGHWLRNINCKDGFLPAYLMNNSPGWI